MRMIILYRSRFEAMVLFKPNLLQRLLGKKSYIDFFERKLIPVDDLPDWIQPYCNEQYGTDPLNYYQPYNRWDYEVIISIWRSKYSGHRFIIPYLDGIVSTKTYTQI